MKRSAMIAALVAAGMLSFTGAASAQSQTQQLQRQTQQAPQRTQGPNRFTASAADFIPIPSRIEHGAVSIRNAGSAAAGASVATVNCHLPGQRGGCPEIPAAYLAAYENPAYPNRLAVNIPAIPAGHVHTHYLTFWDEVTWPSGTYIFEFVADAGSAVGETNEGNNAGSHTWVVP